MSIGKRIERVFLDRDKPCFRERRSDLQPRLGTSSIMAQFTNDALSETLGSNGHCLSRNTLNFRIAAVACVGSLAHSAGPLQSRRANVAPPTHPLINSGAPLVQLSL